MDFVHNPYRCGPLRVGRYGIEQSYSSQMHCRAYYNFFQLYLVNSLRDNETHVPGLR